MVRRLRVKDLHPGMLLRYVGFQGRANAYFNINDVVPVRRHYSRLVLDSSRMPGSYYLWSSNLRQFRVAEGPW